MKIPYLLSLIIWLPALGAIVVLFLFKKGQAGAIKRFATAWFALDFVASLALVSYDRGLGGFQFLEDAQWIPIIGARYQMAVDGVAVLLILLTTLLGWIAALSSWEYIAKREKEYYVLLLLLQTSVLGVFCAADLFLFFLFFEVSLVPRYFLIGIWGGERRLYAAIKFVLYTMVGSLLMLIAILYLYVKVHEATGTWSFAYADMLKLQLTMEEQLYCFAAFALAF
ncbi:MAG TPA: proton-conducting transporter membrane subunit, partial [Pyrinomonadaceae bacterium]|nr:proton-conducting transporter membrane subunit [Pyrinomonadaceae bacterium]